MKEIGASGPWPHASITTSKVQIWSAEPTRYAQYSKSRRSGTLKRQSDILIQSETNNNGNIGYLNQTSRAEEEVIKKEKVKTEAASPNMAERETEKGHQTGIALVTLHFSIADMTSDRASQISKREEYSSPSACNRIRSFAFHLLKKENRCLVFVHHVSYVLSHVIENIGQEQKGKRVLVARDNNTRCTSETQLLRRS